MKSLNGLLRQILPQTTVTLASFTTIILANGLPILLNTLIGNLDALDFYGSMASLMLGRLSFTLILRKTLEEPVRRLMTPPALFIIATLPGTKMRQSTFYDGSLMSFVEK
jgi:hypothetical protein